MTADLAEARGPDVACSIEVPVAWFEAGATLQIQLPRLMTCARCEGGGCDACGRRGAFEQQAAGLAREVAVVLPKQPAESCAPVKLRLPALGARAPQPLVEPSGASAVAQIAAIAEAQPGAAQADREALAVAEGQAVAEAQAAAAAHAGEQDAGAEQLVAAQEPAEVEAAAPPAPPALPPGHLLLTLIPRAPDPAWVPPSNVQALVLPAPARSFWEWLRPLELLLFPDRLVAELKSWQQTRAPAALRALPIWLWPVLAVVLIVLSFWLLTRSGSRSQ